MPLELPLPKIIADVEAGGPFVTSMKGLNALTEQNLKAHQMRLANQYYPRKTEAEIAHKQAQIPHMAFQDKLLEQQAKVEAYKAEHPELSYTGDTQFLEYLKRNNPQLFNTLSNNGQMPAPSSRSGSVPSASPNVGPVPGNNPGASPNAVSQNSNPTIPRTGNAIVDAILTRKFAPAMYQNRMQQAFEWTHTPTEVKTYQIAQLAGAGIDPSIAVSELSKGKTVPQILQEKGFDPNNPPDPDFLPTKGNITQLKQRQAALAETEVLGKKIREALGPYSRTIMNYSIPQIYDAITGKNEEQQARFLAARALAPEQGNLRLKLAGAQTGITAQHEILDKAMSNVNAFQALVNPKVFEKAQRYTDEWLTEAFDAATKSMTKVGKKEEKKEEKNNKDKNVLVFNPKTGRLE